MKYSHSSECAWLFSFDTIREKVHLHAEIEMLHVNEKEAQRLFNRLKSSQKLMQERAMKEEQEGSQKEKVLLNYMQPHSERMN